MKKVSKRFVPSERRFRAHHISLESQVEFPTHPSDVLFLLVEPETRSVELNRSRTCQMVEVSLVPCEGG